MFCEIVWKGYNEGQGHTAERQYKSTDGRPVWATISWITFRMQTEDNNVNITTFLLRKKKHVCEAPFL